MKTRRRTWPLWAGFVLLLPTIARAEPDPRTRSHVPLPSRGNSLDPEQLFAERFGRDKSVQELRRRLQELSGQDLETLLKQLKAAGIDPHDPKFAKQIKDVMDKQAKGGADPKFTPEELDTLKRLFDDMFPGKKPPDKDPTGDPVTDPKTGPATKDKGGHDAGPTEPLPAPDPTRTVQDEEARAQAAQMLLRWAKGLEGMSANMNDSPTLRRTLGDLSRLAMEHGSGRPGGLDTQLANLQRLSRDNGGWLSRSWGSMRRFELPKFPAMSPPSMRLSVNTPSVSVPSGVGTVGSNPGVWKGILVLAAVVVIGVVLWKFLRHLGPFRRRYEEAGWRLGPWPVDPAAVASREDLVRAFEYLSLLLLGRQARSWNHREIAARLGGDATDRRQAAAQLADVYEQARYTPLDEPLSDAALTASRRDLCLLAEGATA